MGQSGSSNQPPAQISGNVPMNRTPNEDGTTWWCRFFARGVAVIGGLVGMATGIAACITLTPLCLVAGILLVLIGLFIVMFESPCCCPFLDFIQPIGRFADRRPYWQKALMYFLPSLLPVILCFELTTMFGSGLMMAGGVLYGMMALGTKADRSTMMTRARGDDVEMKETLMDNEEKMDAK